MNVVTQLSHHNKFKPLIVFGSDVAGRCGRYVSIFLRCFDTVMRSLAISFVSFNVNTPTFNRLVSKVSVFPNGRGDRGAVVRS